MYSSASRMDGRRSSKENLYLHIEGILGGEIAKECIIDEVRKWSEISGRAEHDGVPEAGPSRSDDHVWETDWELVVVLAVVSEGCASCWTGHALTMRDGKSLIVMLQEVVQTSCTTQRRREDNESGEGGGDGDSRRYLSLK